MQGLVDTFRDLDTSQKIVYVVGGCAVAVVSVVVIKRLAHREEKKVYPRDTVILHQIGRGPYAPSMTPFAVKLETYLRMAKIPYQNVHGLVASSKGKIPWMEYNGKEVADSTLCIDFLNKKLDIDLNTHLRPAERGIAQSMQVMLEEHLYWCLALHRWVYDNDKSWIHKAFKLSRFVMWSIRRHFRDQAWKQGMGRHSREEVNVFMERDLKALSDWMESRVRMIASSV